MKTTHKTVEKRRFLTNRGGYRRLLSIGVSALLSASTFLTVIPQTETLVYAADSKAIVLVDNGAATNINGAQASNVYFGNYYQSNDSSKEPIKWRVLQNANGKLFLLSYMNLDAKPFDVSSAHTNVWKDCSLRKWLNGTEDSSFINTAFDDREINAIAPTANVSATDTDKLFLLSLEEVQNTDYGFQGNPDSTVGSTLPRGGRNTAYTVQQGADGTVNGANMWWLRSPGTIRDNFAAFVNMDGSVWATGIGGDARSNAVRPALNVDLSSVILTSAAEGGKSSGATGSGSLNPVDNTSSVTDWKVTIHDTSRDGDGKFKPERTDNVDLAAGKTLTISYSGAATGSDKEFVSAIITDADDTILYYGHIASTQSSASGTATINIPADAPGTMSKLYIFQEQCNGDYKTDYSSKLHDLTEPASKTSDSAVAVTGVSVSPTEVTLKPDATKKLTATVEPDDASNKEVTWKSDDEDTASVSSDGTVTAKAEGETYITVTTADGNKSAKCKVIVDKDAPVVETCTISFDKNGGKGDMDDQTVDKGVKTMLNKNTFTRSGYSFDGWNTDPDGDGTSYGDKDDITVDKDTTLYAQWKKDKDKDDDDDDDSHEENHSSTPSKPSWTPEMAAATIAAEKAANQQQAAIQLKDATTKLTALASLTPSQKASYAKTGLDLVMTRVSIIDANTAKLLVANNKIPYNVKIMFGQSEVTITIPAGFNFKPFIKADGTINIHEVLWSIIYGKTNKR